MIIMAVVVMPTAEQQANADRQARRTGRRQPTNKPTHAGAQPQQQDSTTRNHIRGCLEVGPQSEQAKPEKRRGRATLYTRPSAAGCDAALEQKTRTRTRTATATGPPTPILTMEHTWDSCTGGHDSRAAPSPSKTACMISQSWRENRCTLRYPVLFVVGHGFATNS